MKYNISYFLYIMRKSSNISFVAHRAISWLNTCMTENARTESIFSHWVKPWISGGTADGTTQFFLLHFIGVLLSRKHCVQEYVEEFFFEVTVTVHFSKQTEHCNLHFLKALWKCSSSAICFSLMAPGFGLEEFVSFCFPAYCNIEFSSAWTSLWKL